MDTFIDALKRDILRYPSLYVRTNKLLAPHTIPSTFGGHRSYADATYRHWLFPNQAQVDQFKQSYGEYIE